MVDLEWTGERVVPEKMPIGDATLLEHLVRYNFALDYCKDKTVLDASCGSGYGSEMLQRVAKSVEGLDVDKKTIEYAKEKYTNINFFICDLEKGFPDKVYDVIVSFETIEHLANPHLFLEKAAKSCKQFIFSIPIDNPRMKFHKVKYGLEEARSLINKYFGNVKWFRQSRTNIFPFNFEKRIGYIVGVAEFK